MAYRNTEIRNRRDRERRRESKTAAEPKSEKKCKETFIDWCEVVAESIRTKDEEIFFFDVRLGPLKLRDTRYNSTTGQFFTTTVEMEKSKRPLFKPSWFVGVLRPLIIEAVEKRYGISLDRFD